jgi:hypothetical protein
MNTGLMAILFAVLLGLCACSGTLVSCVWLGRCGLERAQTKTEHEMLRCFASETQPCSNTTIARCSTPRKSIVYDGLREGRFACDTILRISYNTDYRGIRCNLDYDRCSDIHARSLTCQGTISETKAEALPAPNTSQKPFFVSELLTTANAPPGQNAMTSRCVAVVYALRVPYRPLLRHISHPHLLPLYVCCISFLSFLSVTTTVFTS